MIAAPQLTLRAALTGVVLGALLTPCNVYSGLKIGWSFNMSIAAALLSYGFWKAVPLSRRGEGARSWGLLENNVNQTCASSAASIISAGLVAPIPALTILTGQTMTWPVMSVWLFAVSCLGVLVGLSLRRPMIETQGLPFPSGVATAETVREIYQSGAEAARRVKWLLTAGGLSAATKLFHEYVKAIPQIGPAIGLGTLAPPTVTTRSLGFVLDPSWMMIGFGAIVGLRVGCSMLLGALLAWGVLAPWLFSTGRLPAPEVGSTGTFPIAVEFLLWPGVGLMVASAITSFACSLISLIGKRQPAEPEEGAPLETELSIQHAPVGPPREGVPTAWLITGFVAATIFAVAAQVMIFDIAWPMALLAVALTFALAVVAAQVSGETGIPPIGALGKVTQLTFGLIHPTSVSVNLMTANVTGGAAGQCSDLLHDLKAGRLLGASVRAQAAAQLLGVLTGSLVGSAAYLALVPDPAGQLLTKEWPAPAVATWKAVAELFKEGLGSAPDGAMVAAVIGAASGVILAIVSHRASKKVNAWIPSATSMGLAFVIPAFYSLSLFLGACVAACALRLAPEKARRYTLPAAAGLVAGESLAGVAIAIGALLTAV